MDDHVREAEAVYADALRRLTPEAKLAVAQGLRDTAWAVSAAGLRSRHPGLQEEEIQERVRALFLRVAG